MLNCHTHIDCYNWIQATDFACDCELPMQKLRKKWEKMAYDFMTFSHNKTDNHVNLILRLHRFSSLKFQHLPYLQSFFNHSLGGFETLHKWERSCLKYANACLHCCQQHNEKVGCNSSWNIYNMMYASKTTAGRQTSLTTPSNFLFQTTN